MRAPRRLALASVIVTSCAACALLPSLSSSPSAWADRALSLAPTFTDETSVARNADRPPVRDLAEVIEDLDLPAFPSVGDLRTWWRAYGAASDSRVSSFRAFTDPDGSERAYAEVASDDDRLAILIDHARDSDVTVLRFRPLDPQPPARVVAWLCNVPVFAPTPGATWTIPALGIELTPPSAVDERMLGLTHEPRDCNAETLVWPVGGDEQTIMPAHVRMKTATRTFDVLRAYALEDGVVYFKDLAAPQPWRLLREGTPTNPDPAVPLVPARDLIAISADGDELMAVDAIGRVYTHATESKSMLSADGWTSGWGYPGKRAMFLPLTEGTPPRMAIGRRAESALFHEDALGNARNFGPMGTTTMYVLDDDGRAIHYSDNGLPPDLTREMCLPHRGRVKAEAMSASASAVMILDRFGRVFTQFFDYDLNGGTVFYEFSYTGEIDDDNGDSIMSAFSAQQLPLADWVEQPRLPVDPRWQVARSITILQTGTGNAARQLRVVARDPRGTVGTFTKGIEDDAWTFVASNEVTLDAGSSSAAFVPDAGEPVDEPARRALGRLRGQLSTVADGVTTPTQTWIEADDFDPVCASTTLHVRTAGRSFNVTLHAADLWTPAMRHGVPGEDGHPLLLQGTLSIPRETLRAADPVIRRTARALFGAWHDNTFAALIVVDGGRVDIITEDDDPGLHIALTAASPQRTPLATLVTDAHDLAARTALTPGELAHAKAVMRQLRNELELHDAAAAETEAYLSTFVTYAVRAVPIGVLPRMRRLIRLHTEHDPIAGPRARAHVVATLDRLRVLCGEP